MQKRLKQILTALVITSAFGVTSCGHNATKSTTGDSSTHGHAGSTTESSRSAEAMLAGTHPDTTVTGSVRFTSNNGKVSMSLDITVPKKANQSVAVHIHEHGDCGEMGKMAHGHWNPTKVNHGKWGSASFHSGDIGNVSLNGQGRGTMQLETNLWSIGGDSTTNILNRAIIIHGGVDDYTTQPTGNAGSRIGCGVIKKTGM
jgi:Cu-Zn family superoxide dismutase